MRKAPICWNATKPANYHLCGKIPYNTPVHFLPLRSTREFEINRAKHPTSKGAKPNEQVQYLASNRDPPNRVSFSLSSMPTPRIPVSLTISASRVTRIAPLKKSEDKAWSYCRVYLRKVRIPSRFASPPVKSTNYEVLGFDACASENYTVIRTLRE